MILTGEKCGGWNTCPNGNVSTTKCHRTYPEFHLNNIFKIRLFSTSQRTQFISIAKMVGLMLFIEIMTIIRNTHTECIGKMQRCLCVSVEGYTWLTWGFKRLNTQVEQSHLPHCIRHTNVNLLYLKTL